MTTDALHDLEALQKRTAGIEDADLKRSLARIIPNSLAPRGTCAVPYHARAGTDPAHGAALSLLRLLRRPAAPVGAHERGPATQWQAHRWR